MAMKSAATFSACIEDLHAMNQWIRKCISTMPFSDSALQKIELASEEAFVNILTHAYKKQGGVISLCVITVPKSHIQIEFRDDGPPFDPTLSNPKEMIDLPLEKRMEGGLGIIFIQKYMDEVQYRREKSANVLILIKKI